MLVGVGLEIIIELGSNSCEYRPVGAKNGLKLTSLTRFMLLSTVTPTGFVFRVLREVILDWEKHVYCWRGRDQADTKTDIMIMKKKCGV
jgi:hypothetical protein